jgi:ribosome-binding factor A
VSTRTDKLSDLIRAEVSRLLLREVRDPRIGFVTITGASVSPDLRNVQIFASVLGDTKARDESIEALNNAAGFIQRTIFKSLRLRCSPMIVFRLDESIERGDRIERVLRRIHAEESQDPDDREE